MVSPTQVDESFKGLTILEVRGNSPGRNPLLASENLLENTGRGRRSTPTAFSRGGSLLPSVTYGKKKKKKKEKKGKKWYRGRAMESRGRESGLRQVSRKNIPAAVLATVPVAFSDSLFFLSLFATAFSLSQAAQRIIASSEDGVRKCTSTRVHMHGRTHGLPQIDTSIGNINIEYIY